MQGPGESSLRIRDWDTATKFVSILALLAGGVWSVWIYHQSARQQAGAAELDAQNPFATKRLELYDRLVSLTLLRSPALTVKSYRRLTVLL